MSLPVLGLADWLSHPDTVSAALAGLASFIAPFAAHALSTSLAGHRAVATALTVLVLFAFCLLSLAPSLFFAT